MNACSVWKISWRSASAAVWRRRRRVLRDERALLALAAALEQIAERLDVALVVGEVVPAEQLARREHRKILVRRREHRVRLQRRGDLVGLRNIDVQPLRAQLMVVLDGDAHRVGHATRASRAAPAPPVFDRRSPGRRGTPRPHRRHPTSDHARMDSYSFKTTKPAASAASTAGADSGRRDEHAAAHRLLKTPAPELEVRTQQLELRTANFGSPPISQLLSPNSEC